MSGFKFFRGNTEERNQVFIPPGLNENPMRPVFNLQPFEPMRENRYLVTFPVEFQINNTFVKSTSRPSIQVHNERVIWNDIEFKFYNPISPSIQQSLFNFLNNNINFNEHEIKLQMLDPVGEIVSEWIVYGFIKEINFGELDYSSDNPTELTMKIGVNRAILNY
jgi:hypothetical protein